MEEYPLFTLRRQKYTGVPETSCKGKTVDGVCDSEYPACCACLAVEIEVLALPIPKLDLYFRYPNNPVLKVLTPQSTCRNLDIFPVKLTQEAISVDVSGVSDTAFVPQGKGGADSSIDLNNVFAEENRPYYEGQNPESDFFYPSPPCVYPYLETQHNRI